jgi:hypothetical protein
MEEKTQKKKKLNQDNLGFKSSTRKACETQIILILVYVED